MKSETKYLALIGIMLVVVAGFLLVRMNSEGPVIPVISNHGNVKNFESVDELKALLEQENDNYYAYGKGMMAESAAMDAAAPSVAGSGVSERSSTGASDYSTTNIQVEGVDEPDFLKNDDKYIYVISGKKLVIVDAFPADDMKIVSETELEDYTSNLFLNGNKLVVFMNHYEYLEGNCGYFAVSEKMAVDSIGIMPPCGGLSRESTIVKVYDVSDRSKPKVEEEYEVSGNYHDARMIGNYIYLLSTKYISLSNFELPYYAHGEERFDVAASDIYYFDYSDSSYVLNSVSAINLESEEIKSEVFMMGYSSTIFVSENNIYVTMRKTISQQEQTERYAEEVLLKVLPESESQKVKDIMNSDEKIYRKLREISEVLQDYSEDIDGAEKLEFLDDFSKAQQEHYEKISKENDMTLVHKISVDEMDINYEESGEVPGSVLNQFSMDEYDGHFRIATTSGDFWRGDSVNNMYVLDDDLEIVGKIEGLAEGERIYSVRFAGEKAYMVTFKKVDPLFVIDLSDEKDPQVLGYLKIPGYSDYLHPYDETHVIGIGKEAVDAGNDESIGRGRDFAWYQGVKVSLFDVSDFENPKEVAKVEIGDRGTDSQALYDHKAFLFDKEKQLLVLPISLAVIDESKSSKTQANSYGETIWKGAYVLKITEDELSLMGKITHDEREDEDEQYWWSGNDVRRSLFMDDVLYTVSNAKIKANALNDLKEIEEVELPVENYDYPVYYG